MNIARLVISIALCQGIGALAGLLTAQSVHTWYPVLAKPWFTPPGWVFGPAWFTLYLLMGIALYLVWQKRDSLGGSAAFDVLCATRSQRTVELYFGSTCVARQIDD